MVSEVILFLYEWMTDRFQIGLKKRQTMTVFRMITYGIF